MLEMIVWRETNWMLPMNSPRIFLLAAAAAIVALLLLLPAQGRAQRQIIETTNRAGIKLSYITEAKLSELELQQVLTLAQQVGITNVDKVTTGYALPSATKLVTMTSKERVNGRNTSFETVTIHRLDWGGWSKPERAFQSGEFWVDASDKFTRLERAFDIGGTTRRITIQEKDIPIADKAIPLIAAKKVRFKDEFTQGGFERIDIQQPSSLRASDSTHNYELWLHNSWEIIYFRIENGEVVITAVGNYSI